MPLERIAATAGFPAEQVAELIAFRADFIERLLSLAKPTK
jgi:hypothetical protein